MIDFDTHPTDKDPLELINLIDHTRRHHDSKILLDMMEKISGKEAVVWGENVIGFGQYHYVYKTGREGQWPIISFTPSLQNLSINVMQGFSNYESLLKKIGRVKYTGNTLILHKLSDIDRSALEIFIKKVFDDIQRMHQCD